MKRIILACLLANLVFGLSSDFSHAQAFNLIPIGVSFDQPMSWSVQLQQEEQVGSSIEMPLKEGEEIDPWFFAMSFLGVICLIILVLGSSNGSTRSRSGQPQSPLNQPRKKVRKVEEYPEIPRARSKRRDTGRDAEMTDLDFIVSTPSVESGGWFSSFFGGGDSGYSGGGGDFDGGGASGDFGGSDGGGGE